MVQLQPKTYIGVKTMTEEDRQAVRAVLGKAALHPMEEASEEGSAPPASTTTPDSIPPSYKRSNKGCSKATNNYNFVQYVSVLQTGDSLRAVNYSFMVRNRKMYTTRLDKQGPGFRLDKRQVQPCGIKTKMLPN